MAFESKRLRVQLPCEGTSLLEEPVQLVPPTFCPYPSFEVLVPAGLTAQCAAPSVPPCGAGTQDGLGDKNSLIVTPETLTILRRQIETRLAMVKAAQEAIAKLPSADEGAQ
jgi:hypothetical protein